MLPEFPLLNICVAELPIFIRLVDTSQKALSLLLFREVEEKLDNSSAVAVKVFLKIRDRTIPIVPDPLVVVRSVRDALAEQDFGMYAGNQNLFVIGSVEDADSPAFRKVARGAPEKKSCCSSPTLGYLKLKTWHPCGVTPDITCLMAPSFPAASVA